ncbi:atlastin-like isoform X2 [Adelges cooleyi]|uniref:atlastin-like isoform X2 n=1 Tax=Adelges cooleyi TaxID=133065 RepID=UPI0021808801|nr:atlastin-like isoform X2 [Adelges cooleyi]
MDLIENGHPVPIVLAEENHKFTLDEKALENILLEEDIKDRNIVVVSVAGTFRKGKSFLLNFFLRYMKATYCVNLVEETNNWIGSNELALQGFSWRGGSERDTSGILMWSEVFKATLDNGNKVAIVLLDTQGSFDSESTVKDCATVFALSTMLSSIQIYNLSQNIQEDDLQHLQLFTEYGRLALEDTGRKPFQKLQFLVRDWSFPYDVKYGAEGGQLLLKRRLEVSDNQHPELQELRKHIKSCFSDINCFLMPHPGLKVATNPIFDGRLSEIEDEFKLHLKTFIPMLLKPCNLIEKEISGQKVKSKELVLYFKSYVNLFAEDDLPEPKSMYIATAEANNLSAVASAREVYRQLMENICGGKKPYVNVKTLDEQHSVNKFVALEEFETKRKMGGEEISELYKTKLETDIDEEYEQLKCHNKSKNIFTAARTPAIYFASTVVCYFLSRLVGVLRMYALAKCFSFFMGLASVTLVLWAYTRCSGEHGELIEMFDEPANIIWNNLMKPSYDLFLRSHVEQAITMVGKNSTSPRKLSIKRKVVLQRTVSRVYSSKLKKLRSKRCAYSEQT